jgi:hypothetical protein
VVVADPLKRQLCSVSRAVAKTFQVTPPNTDIERLGTGHPRHRIDREQMTDVIPTSEEVCHVANFAPRLPETTRYVGPSALWINQWHDKLQFVDYAISRGVTAPSVYTTADGEVRGAARQTECVVKPRRGCSGTDVVLYPPGSTLPPPSNETCCCNAK